MKRIWCWFTDHTWSGTGKVVAGFLQMVEIDRCDRCGKKRLGKEVIS